MRFLGAFTVLCSLLLFPSPTVAGHLIDPDHDAKHMVGILVWDSLKELVRCDSEEKAMWEYDVKCSDAIVAVMVPGSWVQKLGVSDDGQLVKVKIVSGGYKGAFGWVRQKHYKP